jgi:cytoskeletal protein CcmA (bactofilin family)
MLFTSKQKEEPLIEIHSGIMLKGQLSMARDVLLTGKFEGDLKTAGRLTVATGGAVIGSIEAGALVLEPGYQVEGKIKVFSSAPPKTFDMVKQISTSKWPLRLKKLKELAFGRS